MSCNPSLLRAEIVFNAFIDTFNIDFAAYKRGNLDILQA